MGISSLVQMADDALAIGVVGESHGCERYGHCRSEDVEWVVERSPQASGSHDATDNCRYDVECFHCCFVLVNKFVRCAELNRCSMIFPTLPVVWVFHPMSLCAAMHTHWLALRGGSSSALPAYPCSLLGL